MRLRALWVGFIVAVAGLVLPPAAHAAAPSNDSIASATALTGVTASMGGTNVEATNEIGEPNHASAAVSPATCNTSTSTNCETSVWFKYTAGSTTNYTVDLCSSSPGNVANPGAPSDFDTVLAIYTLTTGTTASVTNLTLVTQNDDRADTTGCSNDHSSKAQFAATSGTNYFIAVAGYHKDIGNVHGVIEPCGTPGANCPSTATPPTATTDPADPVGSTTATLQGKVNPNNQPVAWHFEYGPTTAYGTNKPNPPTAMPSGTTESPVHIDLTGLSGSTTYHFRLVVQYSGGTVNGSDRVFTTQPTSNAPEPTTGTADTKTGTSATLNGKVDPKGKTTTFQFEYGVCTNYVASPEGCNDTTYPSKAPATPGNVAQPSPPATTTSVSVNISGLSQDTHYHFRLKATNSDGTRYGTDSVFTTPLVRTDAATDITEDNTGEAATLNATVNPQDENMLFSFQYGTTTAYGSTAPATPPGANGGTTEIHPTGSVSGLDANTTYHYRIVATGDSGTTNGDDMTFTTFGPPGATTLLPSGTSVEDDGVRVLLNGVVNPHGFEDSGGMGTSYWFEFGTTASYGLKTATFTTPDVPDAGPPDTNDYPVSIAITKRTLGQVYHYRLVARNSSGTTNGTDKSFVAGGDPIYTDFNSDDKRDIVWHNNKTGATVIWTMNNNHYVSTLAVDGINNPATAWSPQAVADFNDDAKRDLLWHNSKTGATSIWLMNANHYVSSTTISGGGTPAPYWIPSVVADFNGDGHPDIAWHNNKTGTNTIWLLNGTTFLQSVPFGPNLGTAWHLVGAGDFNGDGQPDIVLNNGAGKTDLWIMNGPHFQNSVQAGRTTSSAWVPVGTGQFDFDGNGQTDILFHNRFTGASSIWYMKGKSIESTASVDGTNAPALAWTPI